MHFSCLKTRTKKHCCVLGGTGWINAVLVNFNEENRLDIQIFQVMSYVTALKALNSKVEVPLYSQFKLLILCEGGVLHVSLIITHRLYFKSHTAMNNGRIIFR